MRHRYRSACALASTLTVLVAFAIPVSSAQLFFQAGWTDPNSLRPANFQIFFDPAGAQVAQIEFEVALPPGRFRAPEFVGCFSTARCEFDAQHSLIRIRQGTPSGKPLDQSMLCDIELRGQTGTSPGFELLPVQQMNLLLTDGTQIQPQMTGNVVRILAPNLGSTALRYSPMADRDCATGSNELIADAQGRVEISLRVLEPLAQHGIALSCSASEGLSILAGGTQQYPNSALQPIVAQCQASSIPSRQRIDCLEGSSSGERALIWDVDCGASVFDNGFEPAVQPR